MSATIKEALAKLDVANDNHWNKDGSPRVEYVRIYTGNNALTKDEITSDSPEFNRDHARKSAPLTANDPATGEGVGSNTGSAPQDQGSTSTPSTPEQGAQTPAPQPPATTQDQGSTQDQGQDASDEVKDAFEGLSDDERAAKARNAVVGEQTVIIGAPSRTDEILRTSKDAFEIAENLAGKPVGGGDFNGKGEQQDVLRALTPGDYSDEALEDAEYNIEQTQKSLAEAQRKFDEACRDRDTILSGQAAEGSSKEDPFQGYDRHLKREAEKKIAAQQEFGEAFKQVQAQMPQLSPADRAIAADNIAKRKARQAKGSMQ